MKKFKYFLLFLSLVQIQNQSISASTSVGIDSFDFNPGDISHEDEDNQKEYYIEAVNDSNDEVENDKMIDNLRDVFNDDKEAEIMNTPLGAVPNHVIDEIISEMYDENALDSSVFTSQTLFNAIESNNYDKIEQLLKDGVSPNQHIGEMNALVVATTKNDPKTINLLLEYGADSNQSGVNGITPLMTAAFFGYIDTINLLLSVGANPYKQSKYGLNAFVFATNAKNHEQVIQALNGSKESPQSIHHNFSFEDLQPSKKQKKSHN